MKLSTSSARVPRALTLASLLVAALVCLPLVAVLWLALNPRENIWPHLVDTVLGFYLLNTALLMIGVGFGSLLIGISTAWWITHYQFPGRRWLSWALLLPLAVPAYVIAYTYTDLLEFAGPVQRTLRMLFGWQLASDYSFPEIRSLPGAILMLTLVLYPYVYLLARSAFLEQSASVLEVAEVMGLSRRERLWRVALPMARPAIIVGLALVAMETLNDYGTVQYFSVQTLSAGLYDVWLGMNNLGGGAQLASLALLVVVALVLIERASRRRQQAWQPGSSRYRALRCERLQGSRAWLMAGLCGLPVLLGFVIPALRLLHYAMAYGGQVLDGAFWRVAFHSVALAALAALCAALIGTLLAYAHRQGDGVWLRASLTLAGFGYAIPGAVLAIGVIIPLAAFDNALDAWLRERFDISSGLLLSGSVFALVFAYTVRFLAVAQGAIQSSMQKISPHMDDAARALGNGHFEIVRKIHLPLIKSGLLTATLVVFVDCMKELPATLVLRPFNFDTLATEVYQYASDEMLGQAAPHALLIVLVGLVPVILLSTAIDQSRELRRTL